MLAFSKESFIDLLRSKIPPPLKGKPSVEILIDSINRWGKEKYEYSDFSDAISMIDRIEISHPQDKGEEMELSPHNIITSDFFLTKTAPWIEEVRKKIFGSSEVPFDWNRAVEWINKEERKRKAIPKNYLDSLRKKLKTIQTQYGLEVEFRIRFLPYKKRNDHFIYQARINGNPKLTYLEQETRTIEKATGFVQQAIVLYVLTGIEPLIPEAIISTSLFSHKLSERETLFRNEAHLNIKRKDITFRELQKIYKKIRKQLNIERDKPLNPKHLMILMLVKELGDPPKRGEPGYWKYWHNAKEKWNNKNPDKKDKYESWRGIRKAYESIISKLEKNHIHS